MGKHLTFIGMVLLTVFSAIAIAAPTLPGTVITNIAQADFVMGGLSLTEFSNAESFVVEALSGAPADLRITKRASRIVVGIGEVVQYTLKVENVGADATDITVQDRLPDELRFRSVTPASGALSEFTPTTDDGKLLIFDLGPLAAGQVVEFAYYAEVIAGSERGFVVNKAQAFETLTNRISNIAQATVLIREDFFVDASFIAGNVRVGGCDGAGPGVPGVRLYLEDGTVVVTDPKGRFHLEGVKPGLHVIQLDRSSLPAGVEPVRCVTNTRNGGAADAQFIDTQGGALWRADFVLSGKAAPQQSAGAPPPAVVEKNWSEPELKAWIETAPRTFGFVAPAEGFYPSVGAVTIVIAHKPDEHIELTQDGQPVSALNFDGTIWNAAKDWAVSRWRGVDVHDGDNLFIAVSVNKAGAQTERAGRTVHFSGMAIAAEVDNARSTLIADGTTTPVVALKLTARGGHPARPGTFVDVDIEPPYRRQEVVSQRDPTSRLTPTRIEVGEGGVALVRLAPTLNSGEVRIRTNVGGEQRVLKAWLSPAVTDTLLVALAEGTIGLNSISGAPDAKAPENAREEMFADGRVAFFFKSMILGDWLIKAAYDSDRSGKDRQGRLFKEIEPRRYFPIYGDTSVTEHEMDSSGPLFVHLERKGLSFRYGDFDTALSTAKLARYERRLHGVQSVYRGETFGYSAFASDTKNAFVKDEIKGDGTSGLYRLSTHPVVINSERISIEERDRFRNGEVVKSRQMMRHVDYEIDYELGTLFFKEPVTSQSLDLNPLVIVADYETTGDGARNLTFGGRAAAYLYGGRFELGVSGVRQGSSSGAAELSGVDARATLAPGTVLRAELAGTHDGAQGAGTNTAYSVELTHDSETVAARIYARDQDEGFGLDQLNDGASGSREYGAEARVKLSEYVPGLGLEGKMYHRESGRISGSREYGEFLVSWAEQDVMLQAGFRRVQDGATPTTGEAVTNQVLTKVSYKLTERLTARVTHEQTLPGKNTNPDFPTRTVFSADYQVTHTMTIQAAHEIIDGQRDKGSVTRVGLEGGFWEGGRVTTSTERQLTDTAQRVFANVGLSQTIKLEDDWSISASVDRQQRVFSEGEDNGGVGPLTDRESFTAISLGTAFDTDLGQMTARAETRLGTDSRWNFALGHYLSPYSDLSFANSFRLLFEEQETGEETTTADLLLGAAYRPVDGPLILNRLDVSFESDPRAEAESGVRSDTWKIVDNLIVNLNPRPDLEVSLQLGLKYASDRIDGARFNSYAVLTGVEARYDITEQVDLGLRGSALMNFPASTVQYSLGPSVGYSLSDAIWISAGYNVVGFDDDDFSAGGYTSSGVFTQFRARLDSGSARDLANWFTDQ